MSANLNYNPTITVKKGGLQLINIVSSTAFATMIALLLKVLMKQEIEVENIQQGIDSISSTVLFLTPFVSAIVRMISNYIKKAKQK